MLATLCIYIYALVLFYSNVKYSMMAACRFDGNRLNQPCVAKAQRVDMDALTVQPFLVPSFCCFIFVEAPRNKADARDLRKARSTNEPKYSINNSGEHLTDHCNIEHIYI